MEKAISSLALKERNRLKMAYCSWGRSWRMKNFANLYKQNKLRRERNTKQENWEKKMKTRGTNDDIISNNRPTIINILDDNIVVHEILSRLPVKSLMRFKSVCKRWRSLIEHDKYFHDLHLTQSKTRQGLFIIAPIADNEEGVVYWEFFLSFNLFEGKAVLQTIRRTDSMGNNFHTSMKPVNGLICLVTDFSRNSVCVYNLITRKITPWVNTTLYHDEYPRRFAFGFDPVTKEHKVIGVWIVFENRIEPMYTACEILTVGDKSWRRIDEVLPYSLDGASLYVNGSIYWLSKVSPTFEDYIMKHAPEVIVAFDVGSEKFRAIPIPDFIIDQPRKLDEIEYCDPFIDLLEVDGCLALLSKINRYNFKLWIFNDDDHDYTNKEKIRTTIDANSSRSNRRNNWTEMTITLPSCWVGNMTHPQLHTIAGTDQIIFESYNDDCELSVYSYNWKNKSFEKIEIIGLPSSIGSISVFTPLVDTLVQQ